MELEERKVKLVWVDLDTQEETEEELVGHIDRYGTGITVRLPQSPRHRKELRSVAIFRSDGTPMTWGAEHPDQDHVKIVPAIVRPIDVLERDLKEFLAAEIKTLKGRVVYGLYPLDPFYQTLRAHNVRVSKVEVCRAFVESHKASVPRLHPEKDREISGERPLVFLVRYPGEAIAWLYVVAPHIYLHDIEGGAVAKTLADAMQ